MPAFHDRDSFCEGLRNRQAFRLTLTGCDKRALVPHPTRAIFLTNVSFHGRNLGVIGGLGVNGPPYALAAKRFHPVTLCTAAHFLNPAHNPSSLFFSPQNYQIRPHQNTRKVLATTFCDETNFTTTTNFTTIKSNRSE
jgi:hypothetical protein